MKKYLLFNIEFAEDIILFHAYICKGEGKGILRKIKISLSFK